MGIIIYIIGSIITFILHIKDNINKTGQLTLGDLFFSIFMSLTSFAGLFLYFIYWLSWNKDKVIYSEK